MSKGRWQFLRPEREEGLALVLAVVTTTVVTIMVVAMLSFTSASSRDASLKDARQSASALAEAGVGQALAQLASHYYRENSPNVPSPYLPDGKTPVNSSTAFSSSWFATTNSQKSSTDGSPCTYDAAGTLTSTCVTWSVTPLPDQPAGIKKAALVITGTGTVLNPTGAKPLVQTVTARVDVQKVPQLVKTPDYWKEIYTGKDFTLRQGVNITAPLYVGGNLALENTSTISGSDVTLKVLGWAWVKQNNELIGTSRSPIKSAQIAGGCASWKDSQPTQTSSCTINKNDPNWQIWDQFNNGSAYDHTGNPPTLELPPTIEWGEVIDQQNNSPTKPSCTNGKSLDDPSFSLTPSATSYSCTTAIGSIAWNPSTHVLTVDGAIWFSGGLWIDTSNTPTRYEGVGSFFAGGTISTANNAYLCVKIVTSTSECDFANAKNSGSSGYWDARKNLLILQAMGAVIGTNFHFQGGIYSDTSITLNGGGGGTAGTQGPLISPQTITLGQQVNGGFPDFPEITSGSAGTKTPYTLGAPYGGTY